MTSAPPKKWFRSWVLFIGYPISIEYLGYVPKHEIISLAEVHFEIDWGFSHCPMAQETIHVIVFSLSFGMPLSISFCVSIILSSLFF